MYVRRTDKGRQELQPGVRNLSQRERSVLLLADGQKDLPSFAALFEGEGRRIALDLVESGHLTIDHPSVTVSTSARDAVAAPPAPPAEAPVLLASVADPFVGRRSLATTRMFLFDLCERMFARRDPVLAEHFREILREARDRETMLAAAREMVAEIERIAGPERADSISERIAMMLPDA